MQRPVWGIRGRACADRMFSNALFKYPSTLKYLPLLRQNTRATRCSVLKYTKAQETLERAGTLPNKVVVHSAFSLAVGHSVVVMWGISKFYKFVVILTNIYSSLLFSSLVTGSFTLETPM